jgi:hypothetical protein
MFKLLLLALVGVVPYDNSEIVDVYADVAELNTVDNDGWIYHQLLIKDYIPEEGTHVIRTNRMVTPPQDPQTGSLGVNRTMTYNHQLKLYEITFRDEVNGYRPVRLRVKSVTETFTDYDPFPSPEERYDPETWEYLGYEDLPYLKYRCDKFKTAIDAADAPSMRKLLIERKGK